MRVLTSQDDGDFGAVARAYALKLAAVSERPQFAVYLVLFCARRAGALALLGALTDGESADRQQRTV